MNSKGLGRGAILLALAGLMAVPALGQSTPPPNRPRRPPPATKPAQPDVPAPPPDAPDGTPAPDGSTPASPTGPGSSPAPGPAAPDKRPAPEVGPYVQQERPRDLVLRVRVHVNSDTPLDQTTYQDPFSGETVRMPAPRPFDFQTLSMVFPSLPPTASSDPYPRDIKGRLTLNDRPVDTEAEVLRGYPGDVRLLRFDANEKAQGTKCRQATLELELPMRSYRVKFDEKAALQVPWPKDGWPADATSIMKPQLYVETGVDAQGQVRPYESTLLATAISKWLDEEKISDPKNVSPVALAKILTQKVWRDVQVQGEGLSFKRTGELSGMVVRPPDWVLREGRGSPHEVVVVLAAAMRKAGLPARVVIGYDAGSGDAKVLQKSKSANEIRTWVEFMLYDEKNNTTNWVPVDIAKLRETTSRPPPLTQNWKYFGSNDELDMVTPFAFHFHPPTDVVSYGWPGFWGWFVTPEPPEGAEQALSFVVTTMSTKGGEPARDPKKQVDSPPNR